MQTVSSCLKWLILLAEFSLDILIKKRSCDFLNYFAICCHFPKMTHEIVEMKNMLRAKLYHAIQCIENGQTFNIGDKLMETYELMQQLSLLTCTDG